ncbi:hypothetical protein Tco_0729105 [Tanacetum coccineum]|uniref:Uncharacterized protein n=1 Tax=Tanacetum coccineum TaxID=301880 RepID=A0ABQ4YMY3_9ASTR
MNIILQGLPNRNLCFVSQLVLQRSLEKIKLLMQGTSLQTRSKGLRQTIGQQATIMMKSDGGPIPGDTLLIAAVLLVQAQAGGTSLSEEEISILGLIQDSLMFIPLSKIALRQSLKDGSVELTGGNNQGYLNCDFFIKGSRSGRFLNRRTTATAITEAWGFEHTKACFRDEIIPFIKNLKDIFNNFNRYLVEELADVQKVFYQMEQAVEQHRLESRTFEVKMNQVLSENERLLAQAIDKDIVKTVVNLSVNANGENCFTTLEKHCITLEADSQLNHEIFQQENSVLNQNAPSFTQLFELSELKAQSQAKDTVIVKLKEQIKSLRGNGEDSSVKMDMDEIETLNIELEHRVTKLV